MSEKKNTIVSVVTLAQLQACVSALEALAPEVRTVADRGALGMLRLAVKNAKKINENLDVAYTIEWQGDLGKALNMMMGQDMKPEAHEKEQQGEWDV